MPLGGGGTPAGAYARKMPPAGPVTDGQSGIAHTCRGQISPRTPSGALPEQSGIAIGV